MSKSSTLTLHRGSSLFNSEDKAQIHQNQKSPGCCPVLGATILIASLMMMWSSAERDSHVTVKSTVDKDFDPAPTVVSFSPSEGFMFAIRIKHADRTAPFVEGLSVSLSYIENSRVQTQKISMVSLVPCTEQHFASGQDTIRLFEQIRDRTWLCPPLYASFILSGSQFLSSERLLQINIDKCNSNNSQCGSVTSEELDSLYVGIVTTSNLINPSDSNYRQSTVEPRNVVHLSSLFTTHVDFYVEQTMVITQETTLFSQKSTADRSIVIENMMGRFQTLPTFNDRLASITFRKSPFQHTYLRKYNYVDTQLVMVLTCGVVLICLMQFLTTIEGLSSEDSGQTVKKRI